MPQKFGDQDWHPEMRALRYFVCVAEEKSFSKASGRLRIAQPALSRQIANIEQNLGVSLFERHPRGVELTEAGELLLASSYSIFAQLSRAYRDITNNSQSPKGIVVIGTPPTPGEFILPELLKRVKERYPEIELRLVEGFSRQLEKALLSGEIALAVMHDPPNRSDIRTQVLIEERLSLIGPPHVLQQDSYTFEEAAGMPLVMPPRPNYLRMIVDRVADEKQLSLNVVQRVEGVWHLKALVRHGAGCTILTSGAVSVERRQGTLAVRPITDPEITWPLCIAVSEEQRRKGAVRAVEELVVEIMREASAEGIWE